MNILVLTDEVNSSTRKIITKAKFLPLISNTLQEAFYMLKHHSFSAIVIDKKHKSIDALEFILNARELNPTLPIFIIDSTDNNTALLEITKETLATKFVSEKKLGKILNIMRIKREETI